MLSPPRGELFVLALDTFFNARHAVMNGGRQGPIHSHSYRLQVKCRTRTLAKKDQVVVSYHRLRQRITPVVESYNNQFLNDLPVFQRLQPTTENLAAILFQQVRRALSYLPLELTSVTVWESPTESVTYQLV